MGAKSTNTETQPPMLAQRAFDSIARKCLHHTSSTFGTAENDREDNPAD